MRFHSFAILVITIFINLTIHSPNLSAYLPVYLQEFRAREEAEEKRKRDILTGAVTVENANEKKISVAIQDCRNYMLFGDRKNAVKVMEDVQPSLNFQTELGGEAYLELGMALETVDRSEEARKIYGQLVTVNFSQKIRRNALQLLQGLEITLKLKKRGPQTVKPVVDMESLQTMKAILSQGLTNEWDQYKKKDIKVDAWIDYGKKDEELFKLTTLLDVYFVLLKALSPLKSEKIPSDVFRRAFRSLYLSNDDTKLEFIRTRLPSLLSDFAPQKAPKQTDNLLLQKSDVMTPPTNGGAMISMFGNDIDDNTRTKPKKPLYVPPTPTAVFEKNINGSWELMLSIYDKSPAVVTRYELGAVRRVIFLNQLCQTDDLICQNNVSIESYPSFWGMSRSFLKADIEWNSQINQLMFRFEPNSRSSVSPWQRSSEKIQSTQVVWADNELMITREMSQQSISQPDLYTLWKRMKAVIYNKF